MFAIGCCARQKPWISGDLIFKTTFIALISDKSCLLMEEGGQYPANSKWLKKKDTIKPMERDILPYAAAVI